MTSTIRAIAIGAIIAVASIALPSAWAAETILPSGPGSSPGTPPGLIGKPTGNWAKADGGIRNVVAEFMAHQERGEPGEFRPANPSLLFTDGRITVNVIAADDPEALIANLRKLGMQNASSYGKVISGQMPPGTLAQAVALPSLQAISAAYKPHTNDLLGEGPRALQADVWPATGYDGTGIVIGVLSDSFDIDTKPNSSYAEDIASGDLPTGIQVLEEYTGSANDEGRAMMQLAYDVAPDANFAFHTAFGGDADFALGIEELAAAGAKVIVDDVIYFTEPMFQDGIIAQAVDNVVADGVAYFSSAGNSARQSYEADFVDSGEIWETCSFPIGNDCLFGYQYLGKLHDFGGGDWNQQLTISSSIPSARFVSLILQWNEPYASAGGAGAEVDVDIYLTTDEDPSTTIVKSADSNNVLYPDGSGEPVELLQFQAAPTAAECNSTYTPVYGCLVPGETYRLQIAFFDDGNVDGVPDPGAQPPGRLKYVVFDSNIILEHATNSSTLYGHSNAAGAEAVGAAYWQATPAWNCDDPDDPTPPDSNLWDDCEWNSDTPSQLAPQLERYSSAGPTAIYFDTDGFALSEPDVRSKPGIVGPDGTNTTFFYSDTVRDPDPDPNFFGTSASAPHVAGVAALMLEANPTLEPEQIYAALEDTALNMNPRPGQSEDLSGFDHDTGWGFVQADLAVAAVGSGGGDAWPSVTVTAPADGATVSGSTVAITANASDDNGVTQVEFFLDGTTSLGIDTNGGDGWTASWDSSTAGDGPHTLTATATDTAAQIASDSVNVTVDNNDDPPSVSVTAPADGATVSGSTVDITASASDDGSVTQVEFFIDGSTIGTDTNGGDGWSVFWDSTLVADGGHAITAEATDDATPSQSTLSGPVNVTVDNSTPANSPPVAAFTLTDNPCLYEDTIYGPGWVCEFNNASTDPDSTNPPYNDNDIESHEWDYGDGTTETNFWSPTAVYLDSLTDPGTYTVTLTVTDSEGLWDSMSIPVELRLYAHSGDLDGFASTQSHGRWEAQVDVQVLDPGGVPVEGATVNGSWSNGANGGDSCTTGSSGWCQTRITKGNLKNNVPSVTFTVDGITGPDITGANITYDVSANADADGDSDGTMIVVLQPGTSTDLPPNVTISLPSDGATFASGETIDFTAGATDAEDDDTTLTGSISWSSSPSGLTGTGGTTSWSPADGSYTITASVTDTGGNPASDTISITVGTTSTVDVHVAALNASSGPGSRSGRWDATITVTVHDAAHSPIDGVQVDGAWSTGANGSGICITGADGIGGTCEITKSNIKTSVTQVTFTVTDVGGTGFVYAPGDNDVTNTAIVVPYLL